MRKKLESPRGREAADAMGITANINILLMHRNQTTIMSLDWLYTIRMFFRANSSPFSGL